ncbi:MULTISPECIES: MFS transporter [Burkholderia cepacia complex]|uniref:Major facilitator superfamily MFS_1 n=1 Tax=Burkholderia orbicola (strain MC0-3) TaxID=406425 RepID=B1K9W1_BURO0|nr:MULTISPECIES: MFS transporter [Burkholderia cepacia complex]ACA96061.1 major facilitator superfamily MFS_1 [Burkholderia orbicola MC0-3]MCA8085803.1 MFS transporter [Burkholderia cenocepacia]
MSTFAVDDQPLSGVWARLSTRAGFYSFGFILSAWAPLAPLAKSRIGLSDGDFGLALLWFGVGSLVAMPIGSAAVARVGCRRIILLAGPITCACLFGLASTDRADILSVCLFLFGFGIGATESAMNLQAAVVQRMHDEPLMSGFHAWCSIGTIAGSAGVSTLLSVQISPVGAIACVFAVMVALWCVVGRHFIARTGTVQTHGFALPTLYIVWIGMLCFVAFLAEGAVLDWSGVFLVTEKAFPQSSAGYGYAAFALAMTIARLTGDRLARVSGARSILVAGSVGTAAALAALVFARHWMILIALFAAVGFGLANIVPLFFLHVSRQRRMRVELAMPVVATLGYAGMLAGPAVLGAIGELAGLSVSLLTIAAMLLSIALSAHTIVSCDVG